MDSMDDRAPNEGFISQFTSVLVALTQYWDEMDYGKNSLSPTLQFNLMS